MRDSSVYSFIHTNSPSAYFAKVKEKEEAKSIVCSHFAVVACTKIVILFKV